MLSSSLVGHQIKLSELKYSIEIGLKNYAYNNAVIMMANAAIFYSFIHNYSKLLFNLFKQLFKICQCCTVYNMMISSTANEE